MNPTANKPDYIKIIEKYVILLILLTSALLICIVLAYIRSYEFLSNTAEARQPYILKQKLPVLFTDNPQGLQNIAYITMIKDEEDIIYENLVWHFAIGFRKFIIFNNNSTDKTSILLKKFINETKGLTTVFIIEDPIVAYKQYKIMTIGYKMAHELWPEVEWFFPIDADEFWVFTKNPETALASIPNNIDAAAAIRQRYYPTEDYDILAKNEQSFWRRLHYRDSSWFEYNPDNRKKEKWSKIFLRYSDDSSLAMGNHFILKKIPWNNGNNDANQYLQSYFTHYTDASIYGIFIREYHLRSVKQTHTKFTNALKVLSETNILNNKALDIGHHWQNYKYYLKNSRTPEEAAELKFKSYYRNSSNDDLIDDPLPIEQAMELYNKLCYRQKNIEKHS
jgi:hypothetical protein